MTSGREWHLDERLGQQDPGDDSPPFPIDLSQLPQEQLDLLRQLGDRMTGVGFQRMALLNASFL